MDPAQRAATTTETSQILLWVAVLVVVVIVGGVMILLVRRWLLAKDADASSGAGMMEGLRGMRRSGQISEEEYDLIRKRMALRIRDGADKTPLHGGTRGGSE